MSKYSKTELQIMAGLALRIRDDKKGRNERWLRLRLALCLRLGMEPRQVEANIEKLAEGALI